MSEQNKKYRRKLIGWVPGTDKPLAVETDVYRVLDAFKVTDPCLQHLIKKALAAGERGHKDLLQDCQDIVHSANSAIDLIKGKQATLEGETQAGYKPRQRRVGAEVFISTTPTSRFQWPNWLEQALTNMDWVHVAHDEWAATSTQLQNMPRAAAFDFSDLERLAIASLGDAYLSMAQQVGEACAPNEEDPKERKARNSAMAYYTLTAPYGAVAANHVRLLQHKCRHCKAAVLSCEMPRHEKGVSGYPGASCPHCKDDLAGATFVNWADVEAVFGNLVKVPPEHLRSFLKAVRLLRAGYGTHTSLRAALHNYYVQVLGGHADDADKFARKVWPELPPEKTKENRLIARNAYRRKVARLAKIFAGYGVSPGVEVVISGAAGDLKGMITAAVARLEGVVRASVTQHTKLLVAAEKPGAKLAKAMELGVTIVFAENLRRILKTKPLEE